ncbi:hypothetical protein C8N46_1063 [Kordia periserrulae]|uniref:Uncharacterized protein n=1 Tax=Kordia periserrulae TaxID=701523 RepID=A0A2T6BWC7_9FLAO|nr:hypothetical protein C8N46_1063 [Kordia periserrulae]
MKTKYSVFLLISIVIVLGLVDTYYPNDLYFYIQLSILAILIGMFIKR